MIEIILRIDDASGCGSRGRAWIADVIVAGRSYSARSHSGAGYALARMLVDAGVADQPVQVSQVGLAGHLTWPSLHKMATRTIAESATKAIRCEKWAEWAGVTPINGVKEDLAPWRACRPLCARSVTTPPPKMHESFFDVG